MGRCATPRGVMPRSTVQARSGPANSARRARAGLTLGGARARRRPDPIQVATGIGNRSLRRVPVRGRGGQAHRAATTGPAAACLRGPDELSCVQGWAAVSITSLATMPSGHQPAALRFSLTFAPQRESWGIMPRLRARALLILVCSSHVFAFGPLKQEHAWCLQSNERR